MALGFLDLTSTRVVPDKDFKKSLKPIFNIESFGEGYDSRVSIGTNSYEEVYSVAFTNRSSEEIVRISSFLNEREKFKNFSFTVPDSNEPSGEKEIIVYCPSYNRVYVTDTIGSINCDFIRVFEDQSEIALLNILNSRIILDEGVTETINLTSTNRGPELLYWTLSLGASPDFTAVSGSFSMTGTQEAATGSFNLQTIDDVTTEGQETYTLSIREGSIGGAVLVSKEVLVLDTSVGAEVFQWVNDQGDPVGSENITSGQSLTVYVGVSNFDPAENIYFSIDPIASSSLLANPTFGVIDLSGSFASSSATKVLQSILDVEQSTPRTLNLRKNSISGEIVDTITLNFLPESFIGGRITNALQQDIDFVLLELGSPYTTTINYTANFFDIQTIYWTIENATGGVDFDLISGSFTPTGTNNLNTATFDVVKQSGVDTEAFIISLRTGSAVGPVIDSCVLVYGTAFITQTEELDSLNPFDLAENSQVENLIRYTVIVGAQETESINNRNIFSLVAPSASISELQRQGTIVVSKTENINLNNPFDLAENGQVENLIRYTVIVGAEETESINNTNTFSSTESSFGVYITRT